MKSNLLNPIAPNSYKIRPEIQLLSNELISLRRTIHQYPELAFKEERTAKLICDKLNQWGIDYQNQIAKTGVVATIYGKQPGKVLAIRADMDALPILEENEIDYKSVNNGVMHACGHDGHTAIALITARYLSQHRDNFNGIVKIIFQPAEEGPGGAKPMIEAGVLKNPNVDGIIGLHLWNSLHIGTIGVRSGALMAATEKFQCVIHGKGGHGAIPDQTIDAILVASQIINNLQSIVARNVSPIDSAVITVGTFQAGTASNVIADSATFSGTVRYYNPILAEFLPKKIEQVIAGICQSYGANYKLDYTRLYPPVINDNSMAQLVRSVAENVIESPLGIVPDCQTMAGEDMSFFLQEVPGCYFFLGSANPQLNLTYAHHHPRFNFDESALMTGVEIFVRCVSKFTTDIDSHLIIR